MGAQSSVPIRGPPRACNDAIADHIRGWEAEDFPSGSYEDSHAAVGAPALLAQEVSAAHEA